jgi:hypothetical protein
MLTRTHNFERQRAESTRKRGNHMEDKQGTTCRTNRDVLRVQTHNKTNLACAHLLIYIRTANASKLILM